VNRSDLSVTVKNGYVSLKGEVHHAMAVTKAKRAAWVPGVIDVDASHLDVLWSSGSSMEADGGTSDVSDSDIHDAINERLNSDSGMSPFPIDISVSEGIVTLSGTVTRLTDKRRAEQLTSQIKGVRRVKNFIKVRVNNPASDSELAKTVRAVLDADPFIDRSALEISAWHGAVYLSGWVDFRFNKNRIEKMASRVHGVTGVANHLQVKHAEKKSDDWEMRQDIQDQLWWSPFVDEQGIEVRVLDGVATLLGTVDSLFEKRMAEKNAYEGGARRVKNQVTVQVS